MVEHIVQHGYRDAQTTFGCSRGKLYDIVQKNENLYKEAKQKLPSKRQTRCQRSDIETKPQTFEKIRQPEQMFFVLPNPDQQTQTNLPAKQETSQNIIPPGTSPLAHVLAANLTGKIIEEKVARRRQREKPIPPREPKPLPSDERVIISKAVSRSQIGMQIAHPYRKRMNRRVEPGLTINAYGEEWTLIGWSDGRDVGNGCLNLVLARPERAKEILRQWQTADLNENNYTFHKLHPDFYRGTPAEGHEELQGGEEIRDKNTNALIGYYLVPAATAVPDAYFITEAPFC